MAFLLWLAAALIVAWFIVFVLANVTAFAIHVLLFAAAIALIAWGVSKLMHGRSHVT
jgi:hypothetical protein